MSQLLQTVSRVYKDNSAGFGGIFNLGTNTGQFGIMLAWSPSTNEAVVRLDVQFDKVATGGIQTILWGSNARLQLEADGELKVYYEDDLAIEQSVSFGTMSDNTRQLIRVSFLTGSVEALINGQLVGTNPATPAIPSFETLATNYDGGSGSDYFSGRIYTRLLTDPQDLSLSRFYPLFEGSGDIVVDVLGAGLTDILLEGMGSGDLNWERSLAVVGSAPPEYFSQSLPYFGDALAVNTTEPINHYHMGLPFVESGRLAVTIGGIVDRVGNGGAPFAADGRLVFSTPPAITHLGGVGFTFDSQVVDATIPDGTPPAAPTIDSQATADSTPTITGGFDSVRTDELTVTVAGTTYTLTTSPELTNIGNSWTLQIVVPISDGAYTITASAQFDEGSVPSVGTDQLLIKATPPVTPTVDAQSTTDTTPIITGTATLAAGDAFAVVINTKTYTPGDGNLTVTGSAWSLQIPEADSLNTSTYNCVATTTDIVGTQASGNADIEITGAGLNGLTFNGVDQWGSLSWSPLGALNSVVFDVNNPAQATRLLSSAFGIAPVVNGNIVTFNNLPYSTNLADVMRNINNSTYYTDALNKLDIVDNSPIQGVAAYKGSGIGSVGEGVTFSFAGSFSVECDVVATLEDVKVITRDGDSYIHLKADGSVAIKRTATANTIYTGALAGISVGEQYHFRFELDGASSEGVIFINGAETARKPQGGNSFNPNDILEDNTGVVTNILVEAEGETWQWLMTDLYEIAGTWYAPQTGTAVEADVVMWAGFDPGINLEAMPTNTRDYPIDEGTGTVLYDANNLDTPRERYHLDLNSWIGIPPAATRNGDTITLKFQAPTTVVSGLRTILGRSVNTYVFISGGGKTITVPSGSATLDGVPIVSGVTECPFDGRTHELVLSTTNDTCESIGGRRDGRDPANFPIWDVQIDMALGDSRFYAINEGAGSVVVDSVSGQDGLINDLVETLWTDARYGDISLIGDPIWVGA